MKIAFPELQLLASIIVSNVSIYFLVLCLPVITVNLGGKFGWNWGISLGEISLGKISLGKISLGNHLGNITWGIGVNLGEN